VLWTRLAPDPLNGGGMSALTARIDWKVATDPAMSRVVRRGTTTITITARNGHAVSVLVDDLRPDSWYCYQFSHRGVKSRISAAQRFADPVFTVPSTDLPVSDVAAFNLLASQPGLTRVL
jgi:alkaline phosphatase D